jgi:metal-sulfur cluster biosynthetic enzyme
MFIQTEATPDPARLKFLPGREVLAEGTLAFRDGKEAGASPLAQRLFTIEGVAGVSFDRDSITVTRSGGDWQHLKPAILGVIMEHFMAGMPVLRQEAASHARASAPPAEGDENLHRIRDSLRQVIDPELGYNIVDLGLVYDIAPEEGGVIRITMTTTTPGCPATNYLKNGAGEAAGALPGVEFVDVELTYEPRWTPEMMSPEAKAYFGIEDGGGW